MNIFILNEVYSSSNDCVAIDSYVFNSFCDATKKMKEIEAEWIQSQKEINDLDDDGINKWLEDHIDQDINIKQAVYKSYIYDNGNDEKVFSIEKKNISNEFFVLTKESVFTKDQFEIDHSVEMITSDFDKALKMAHELKSQALIDLDGISTEESDGFRYEFAVIDPEYGDRVYIKLGSMEVE